MPDKEHLELMTTEKVVPPLVRVAEHPTVKSLHVLAGIGGAVLAFLVVLVGVFGWLFRVAPFVLTGMVCVLAWLIFCYFWMIPKIKRLIAENKTLKELSTNSPRLNGELETANREITILTVENSALKGEIAQTKEDYEYDSRRFQALYEETETLKAAHQEKLEWNQKVHEGDIRERDAFLQKFEFLVETVSRQREEIDAYVELERFFYCRIDTGTVPTLILAAEIRNRSFFFVELDNSVSGSLQFDDLPLLGDKRFNPHNPISHSPDTLETVYN